jgi:hypothetical protein
MTTKSNSVCDATWRKLSLQHHGAAAVRLLLEVETHLRESKSDYLAGELPVIAELIETIEEEVNYCVKP